MGELGKGPFNPLHPAVEKALAAFEAETRERGPQKMTLHTGGQRDALQELADSLMGVLLTAVRRLSAAGLSTPEIIAIMQARLAGSLDPVTATAEIDSVVNEWTNHDHGSGPGWHDMGLGADTGPTMGAPPGADDDRPGREHDNGIQAPDAEPFLPPHGVRVPVVANPEAIGDPEQTPVVQLVKFGDPSGLPVGTVVTDSRSRACWLTDDGWRRAGTDAILSWAEIVQAVGGPENTPQPGQPVIVAQPPTRAQVPTIVRPGTAFDVIVEKALLDGEGKPLVDPATGRPRITREKDSIEIGEIVPDPDARP